MNSTAARYVRGFEEIDRTQIAAVGGKGANLGELSRIPGVHVPAGVCITTEAFRRITADASSIDDHLYRLARLEPSDRESIRTVSAAIRGAVEAVPLPVDLADAITKEIERIGGDIAYAVRSSATSEDLPTASFAGQHDSYLNILGTEAILQCVSRCFASLFTERAVTYRMRNRVDHTRVHMAVVVQRMVIPEAAGVVFTADPVTSNRKIVSVEATPGLGEGLVSGTVTGDIYKVRDGEVFYSSRQRGRVLTDPQAVQIAALGRQIEAHFGGPQDIEWCLVDDGFQVVQSRPITTLFPIPRRDDSSNHVYVSVGHGQMMTDPMKPLGLSMWQLTALPPMHVAGGRLFVDVTERLAAPASRPALLAAFGRGDPLIEDALKTVLARDGFLPKLPDDTPAAPPPGGPPASIDTDPAIVRELIARAEESIDGLRRDIQSRSGSDLLDFILADVAEMKRILFDPLSQQAIRAGMEATWWLNDQMLEWLGEPNAADVLTRSAPNNITSQMGLDLLDVADIIRPHPEVIDFLSTADDDFVEGERLLKLEGGVEAHHAVRAYLDTYGMRGLGEIDITRPRWCEQPTALVPVILGNVRNFRAGEARRRFEQGKRDAHGKEVDLLACLRRLPEGGGKAGETKRMIERVRTFIGYREFPKYGMISRYFIYKQALLAEAERLVRAGVIGEREDIFFLSFEELRDIVRGEPVDNEAIRERKRAFASYGALTPPRVLTSDGEAIAGSYRRNDLPPGALVGLAVSAGSVEGRARVIVDIADADIEEGDILVTTHTDPSWSPLFVAIQGLVTEVGGLMTHGAVIAREYGLPAVVGVEQATRRIEDGQRIRVNGTDGYVELLL